MAVAGAMLDLAEAVLDLAATVVEKEEVAAALAAVQVASNLSREAASA